MYATDSESRPRSTNTPLQTTQEVTTVIETDITESFTTMETAPSTSPVTPVNHTMVFKATLNIVNN